MDDRTAEQAAPPDSTVQGLVRRDGAQIAPFAGVELSAIRELLRVAIENGATRHGVGIPLRRAEACDVGG